MNIQSIDTVSDLLEQNRVVQDPMDIIKGQLTELTPVQTHELVTMMVQALFRLHKSAYNETGKDCWLIDGVTYSHIGRLLDTIDWD